MARHEKKTLYFKFKERPPASDAIIEFDPGKEMEAQENSESFMNESLACETVYK